MTSVFSLFIKGGFVMYPLFICMLIIVYITINRILYYRTEDSGQSFTHAYCEMLANDSITKASALAVKTKGQCAAIMTAAASIEKPDHLDAFLNMKAGIAVTDLKNLVSYLNAIITLAPLLGLLGTITGMIHAFNIFNLKAGEPMAITGGIGEALIATATGLCVAMISLICYTYLNHRIDTMITSMEQCAAALSEARLRGTTHATHS